MPRHTHLLYAPHLKPPWVLRGNFRFTVLHRVTIAGMVGLFAPHDALYDHTARRVPLFRCALHATLYVTRHSERDSLDPPHHQCRLMYYRPVKRDLARSGRSPALLSHIQAARSTLRTFGVPELTQILRRQNVTRNRAHIPRSLFSRVVMNVIRRSPAGDVLLCHALAYFALDYARAHG